MKYKGSCHCKSVEFEIESDLSFISNRAHLESTNLERSQMRVVSPRYISQFVDKFEEILNND